MSENTNGRFISWKWLVGILISIILIGFSAWGAGLSSYIKEVDNEANLNTQNIAALKEAISTLKEDNKIIQSDLKLILKEIRK